MVYVNHVSQPNLRNQAIGLLLGLCLNNVIVHRELAKSRRFTECRLQLEPSRGFKDQKCTWNQ